MFGLLHQYLVENKALYLQGTGQLQLVHQPASFDVTSQLLNAPQSVIKLQTSKSSGSLQPLMSFISRQMDIAEETAFTLYESFCAQLHQDLVSQKQVIWHHLGMFKRDDIGNIIFVSEPTLAAYKEAVTAKRVIRKNAAHNMTVGTMETTNTAMREMLTLPESSVVRSRPWWIGAAVVAAISILLILLKKFNIL